MRIRDYIKPGDLNEAYERLVGTKDAVVMAGGMFLRLQKRTLPLVIDLSDLGLEGIKIKEGTYEIGAMTTLRHLETSRDLPMALNFGMRNIAGVSLRNMATLGGSVMGKYPFSDVITPLLALDATLHFHSQGEMPLSSFMETDAVKADILTKITFLKPSESAFRAYKKVYTDFSLVNVAVAENEGYTIAIGARPGYAKQIKNASLDDIESILDTFEFGTDHRSGSDYRRALAKALLEDIRVEMANKEGNPWK